MSLIGGIEAGGTKFVCAVGSGPNDIRAEHRFPTTTPEETLAQAIAFFQAQEGEHGRIAAIGIAAFGPLDPNPASPTFGYITTTPKPGWANADVVGVIKTALGVPVGFDTDVNGAALGEHRWGAAQDVDTFIYLTIGTGVGGGVMVNGRLLHGLIHPELGHISLPHDWAQDPYKGRCPYHGDCLEGMAAGPAIGERWGQPAFELPADHPAWELEAHYLALALRSYICTLSPQRIIMGGGVMEQPQLFPLLRQKTIDYLAGYVQSPAILERIDSYIVPPGLGNQAGVLGAMALGMAAL
ncbi:MAG: ROK family protein [Chloroflexi bacterium]|nr:ROK family protein [Chloroflexota bacterium]MBK6710221.1 ROK family protein [Chloroflexota bacterium]MBK7178456.1 ROK family protein [Chloroflexota bacterium]MBK7920407.1 ROK family protein [Chloroflexota bacterium]MBK8933406.1 ROK family protein [Chloroflexota bacterium]